MGAPFEKKGKVLWRRIVNSGWARPTVRAQDRKGRTTDRDCLRTRIPSRIDLAVLPRHSYRRHKAAKEQQDNTYNPGERRVPGNSWIAASP
jgi:hypothetical protein